MLEIDGVRHAIESSASFEMADRISDIYLNVIDLATRPTLSQRQLAALHSGRRVLAHENTFITKQLERNQLEEEPLTDAYWSALTQIDKLIKEVQLA